MPNAICIKAGGLDDKSLRRSKMAVESNTTSRMHFSAPVDGADQKLEFFVILNEVEITG